MDNQQPSPQRGKVQRLPGVKQLTLITGSSYVNHNEKASDTHRVKI